MQCRNYAVGRKDDNDVDELAQYKIKIAVLQQMRWRGQGIKNKSNFSLQDTTLDQGGKDRVVWDK